MCVEQKPMLKIVFNAMIVENGHAILVVTETYATYV